MNTKSIFISIIGRTNAGKSSLMNLLVGEKIAIISPKPQTTRTKINGILTKGETQYVFVDTPGLHKGKTKLSEHMTKSASDSMRDVEMVLLMMDATRKISPAEYNTIETLKAANQPAMLLLNKVDLVSDKSVLLKLIEDFSKLYPFKEILPISVVKKINTDKILPLLDKCAVESPHFFPDDQVTDQSQRAWLAEIVREKVLYNLNEEIPHGVAVEIESLDEHENRGGSKIKDIGVVIICEKDSHKGIIIGKQGATLKKIATLAREELEDFYGEKVNLQCFVKVKEDWRNRERLISDFGLDSKG